MKRGVEVAELVACLPTDLKVTDSDLHEADKNTSAMNMSEQQYTGLQRMAALFYEQDAETIGEYKLHIKSDFSAQNLNCRERIGS